MARAVVTGAGRGIGAAIADRLTADGFDVVRLDRVAGDDVVPCDVTDPDDVARVAADVGPVDVLVNNAGVWLFETLEDVAPDDFRRVVDVNLLGTFHCTQAFGRGMLAAVVVASSTSRPSPPLPPARPSAPTRRPRPRSSR